MTPPNKKFVIASLIPTGIRCSIGGYIGDATLVTNNLAAVADYVITNPNAVNGGAFNFKEKNVLYVEGYAIDQFFRGNIELNLPKKNSVGVILENISDSAAMRFTLKAIEAFKTVAGIDIKGIEYIESLKKKVSYEHGQLFGKIEDIGRLITAAQKLKNEHGVEAIALCTHIPVSVEYVRQYQNGTIPNPYGQMEALLSHSVVDALGIPAAHAPLLTKEEMDFFLFNSFESDSRAALENVSPAYIGSVLLGLDTAPLFVDVGQGEIGLSEVQALVIPSNCLRSIPVAMALKHQIPIIEVAENTNIFDPLPLNIRGRVMRVDTYGAAVEVINNLRAQTT